MDNETTTDEVIDRKGDSADVYSLRESSALPETVIAPSGNLDIFAIKKENSFQLGSLIGMTLDKGVFLCQAYRLDKRLSRDEMGETWQASDLRESRNVVIHLSLLEIRKDDTAIEPIRQNAKHVEALDHPRIVPLLANFTDPEHGFFTVRKFVNGKTLDVYRTEYVKRHGKLAPIKIIKMLTDIAHALDYAHGVGIVHGDLCLKNVIVDLNDEVYVDNFALSPIQAETASVARKPYLAPEIIEGHPATAQSDVYALAVIAYNLLTGCVPFLPETMDDTPLPIPGVPSTVDAIIRRAISKDPDDRYNSCGAFVKALETGFHESLKIKSVTVTPSSKSSGNKTASRISFWLALIGLLCIVGGVAAVLYMPILITEQQTNEVNNEVKVAVAQQPAEEPPSEPVLPVQPTEIPPAPPKEVVETTETERKAALTPDEIPPPTLTIEQEIVPPAPVVKPDDVGHKNGLEFNELAPSVPTSPVEIAEPPPTAVVPDLPQHDPGERKVIDIGGIEYAFRWCPPGQFIRGSPENEPGRKEDETVHIVNLTRGFWIQEIEVTQGQWQPVMWGENPSFRSGSRLPVERVTWDDCQRFIERLNGRNILASAGLMGHRFALPTEAQWEYACRAGTTTAFAFGNDLTSSDANFANEEGTRRTGLGEPNAWGIYDMHGNVREWCFDRYGEYPGGSVSDPTGTLSSTERVHRGGGWESAAAECRSAHRSRSVPNHGNRNVGLRLVIVP